MTGLLPQVSNIKSTGNRSHREFPRVGFDDVGYLSPVSINSSGFSIGWHYCSKSLPRESLVFIQLFTYHGQMTQVPPKLPSPHPAPHVPQTKRLTTAQASPRRNSQNHSERNRIAADAVSLGNNTLPSYPHQSQRQDSHAPKTTESHKQEHKTQEHAPTTASKAAVSPTATPTVAPTDAAVNQGDSSWPLSMNAQVVHDSTYPDQDAGRCPESNKDTPKKAFPTGQMFMPPDPVQNTNSLQAFRKTQSKSGSATNAPQGSPNYEQNNSTLSTDTEIAGSTTPLLSKTALTAPMQGRNMAYSSLTGSSKSDHLPSHPSSGEQNEVTSRAYPQSSHPEAISPYPSHSVPMETTASHVEPQEKKRGRPKKSANKQSEITGPMSMMPSQLNRRPSGASEPQNSAVAISKESSHVEPQNKKRGRPKKLTAEVSQTPQSQDRPAKRRHIEKSPSTTTSGVMVVIPSKEKGSAKPSNGEPKGSFERQSPQSRQSLVQVAVPVSPSHHEKDIHVATSKPHSGRKQESENQQQPGMQHNEKAPIEAAVAEKTLPSEDSLNASDASLSESLPKPTQYRAALQETNKGTNDKQPHARLASGERSLRENSQVKLPLFNTSTPPKANISSRLREPVEHPKLGQDAQLEAILQNDIQQQDTQQKDSQQADTPEQDTQQQDTQPQPQAVQRQDTQQQNTEQEDTQQKDTRQQDTQLQDTQTQHQAIQQQNTQQRDTKQRDINRNDIRQQDSWQRIPASNTSSTRHAGSPRPSPEATSQRPYDVNKRNLIHQQSMAAFVWSLDKTPVPGWPPRDQQPTNQRFLTFLPPSVPPEDQRTVSSTKSFAQIPMPGWTSHPQNSTNQASSTYPSLPLAQQSTAPSARPYAQIPMPGWASHPQQFTYQPVSTHPPQASLPPAQQNMASSVRPYAQIPMPGWTSQPHHPANPSVSASSSPVSLPLAAPAPSAGSYTQIPMPGWASQSANQPVSRSPPPVSLPSTSPGQQGMAPATRPFAQIPMPGWASQAQHSANQPASTFPPPASRPFDAPTPSSGSYSQVPMPGWVSQPQYATYQPVSRNPPPASLPSAAPPQQSAAPFTRPFAHIPKPGWASQPQQSNNQPASTSHPPPSGILTAAANSPVAQPPQPPQSIPSYLSGPKDFHDGRHITIKSDPSIIKRVDENNAAQNTRYNPATIARDILVASGRHPTVPPLNHHLLQLRERFKFVDESSDLATFRWDRVDPGRRTPKDYTMRDRRKSKQGMQMASNNA